MSDSELLFCALRSFHHVSNILQPTGQARSSCQTAFSKARVWSLRLLGTYSRTSDPSCQTGLMHFLKRLHHRPRGCGQPSLLCEHRKANDGVQSPELLETTLLALRLGTAALRLVDLERGLHALVLIHSGEIPYTSTAHPAFLYCSSEPANTKAAISGSSILTSGSGP